MNPFNIIGKGRRMNRYEIGKLILYIIIAVIVIVVVSNLIFYNKKQPKSTKRESFTYYVNPKDSKSKKILIKSPRSTENFLSISNDPINGDLIDVYTNKVQRESIREVSPKESMVKIQRSDIGTQISGEPETEGNINWKKRESIGLKKTKDNKRYNYNI